MARLLKYSAAVARLQPSGRASRRQRLGREQRTIGLRFPGCVVPGRGVRGGGPPDKQCPVPNDTEAPRWLRAEAACTSLALPRGVWGNHRMSEERGPVGSDAELPAGCSCSCGRDRGKRLPRRGFPVPPSPAAATCGGSGLGKGTAARPKRLPFSPRFGAEPVCEPPLFPII